MRDDLPSLSRDLAGYCLARIEQLPDDTEAEASLVASARGHLETVLHLLDPAGDPAQAAEDPEPATAYSRLMARRGVDADAVMRANRLGLTWFWDVWRERIAALPEVGELRAELLEAGVEPVIAYSEDAVSRIPDPHESERRAWLRTPGAIRADQARRLLAGDPAEPDATESRLGYRLHDRAHVAVIAWRRPVTGVTPSEGANEGPDEPGSGDTPVAALAEALKAPAAGAANADAGEATPGALVLPGDNGEAWAWVHAEDPAAIAAAPGRTAAGPASGLCLAIGDAATGVEGFRRSHEEARKVARLAQRAVEASPPVTYYRDVAAPVLLTSDPDGAARFAAAELGPLAVDDSQVEALRATLLAYLGNGCRFAAAGRALDLHENTVAYRVRRAEELLGRTVTARALELHAALSIHRHLPAGR